VVTEFPQIVWDSRLEEDCRRLVRMAIREDLEDACDWTTVALVGETVQGSARLVARQAGVLAGLAAIPAVLDEAAAALEWKPQMADGQAVSAGSWIGSLAGSARDLLTLERPILNLVGHLSGIASLTSRFVQETAGTPARIYDTRKTLLGWRRLEKYAVRCGGGSNHRLGLCSGVMIKDNHLACGWTQPGGLAKALEQVRQFLAQSPDISEPLLIEVEVDSLEQLAEILPHAPDIVLLDNMDAAQIHQAVALRDTLAPHVELEASGQVSLQTVRQIAEQGVDRISIGALTHSARNLDIALDWESRAT
jgi:nicotinate-nucleotide pyrophosphorylase (carboxylating)